MEESNPRIGRFPVPAFLCLNLVFFVLAVSVHSEEAPREPGAYLWSGSSGWIGLLPAPVAGARAEGTRLFLLYEGTTNFEMIVQVQGSSASVRTSVARPTFFVREIGNDKEALVVRLKKKKDVRVYTTSYWNITTENRGGFPKKDIYKLICQVQTDGSFVASTEKALPPGEYLLIPGGEAPFYDFGVDRK